MSILRTTIGDHIVVVTVDNPKRRNALGELELRELAQLWKDLAADVSVRVVVVRGSGEHAFCSGADLSAGLARLADIDELTDAALLKTQLFPKPVIAAIGGACVAGGLELALACDIRVIAADLRIGLPEVRWGIMPSGGAAMKLCDLIGTSDAMRLLLTGELIDGAEAAAMGLGQLQADAGAVYAEALRLAQLIAQASPIAIQATKRAAFEAKLEAYKTREPRERELVAGVRASGDMQIGINAFFNKLNPIYPDR